MPYVYHIIAYNLLIFKELQAIDSTLEEPAKIFNDGNWTLDVFVEYCEKVQTLMAKAYGIKGEANSKKPYMETDRRDDSCQSKKSRGTCCC